MSTKDRGSSMIDVLKVLGVTAGTVGAFFAPVGPEPVMVPFFNASLTTVGMATAGSLLAFAYGTPLESRKKLYGYAIGGIFIGVWGAQVIPYWLDWKWYYNGKELFEPPIAGVMALLSRWVVPFVVEQLPSVWKRIFNTGDKPQ